MSRISPVKRASVANPGYPHVNKLSIGAVTLALSPKAPPGEIANSEVFSKRLSSQINYKTPESNPVNTGTEGALEIVRNQGCPYKAG